MYKIARELPDVDLEYISYRWYVREVPTTITILGVDDIAAKSSVGIQNLSICS